MTTARPGASRVAQEPRNQDIAEVRSADSTTRTLRMLFDDHDDLVYASDIATYELLYANRALVRHFGNGPKGTRCFQLFFGRSEPCPFCTNHLIASQRRGTGYSWNQYNPRLGRWVRWSDRTIELDDGRVVHVGMARDVDERHRYRQSLEVESAWRRTRLEIQEKAQELQPAELYRIVLETAVTLTSSAIGFLHQLNDDRPSIPSTLWFDETMGFSETAGTEALASFPGLAERVVALRDGTHNALDHLESVLGSPLGPRVVSRVLCVPSPSRGTLRLVLGVSGKAEPYGECETTQLQLMVNEVAEILARRSMELELRASESLGRAIIESLPQMMVVKGVDLRYVLVNHRFADGAGKQTTDFIGKTDEEVFSPELAAVFAEKDRLVLETRKSVFWTQYYDSARRMKWVSIIKAPIIDSDGVLRGILSLAWDVTEEYTRARQLHRFRRAIDESADMLLLFDADTLAIVDCNQAALQALGYERDELLSTSILDIGGANRGGDLDQVIERTQQNGNSSRCDAVLVRKSGAGFPVDLTLRWHESQEGRLWLALARDMTERRQAEMIYQSLLDTAFDGVITLDDDGFIIDANDSYARMLGYSPEQLVGRWLADLEATEDELMTESHLERVRRFSNDRFETRHRKLDGSCIDVEVNITHVDVDGGRFFAFVRDISERLALEDQLRQSQKMDAVGRLAGGIAHDFNNVLHVMLGYGEFLRAGLSDHREMSDIVDELITGTERAAALTRQLLAFSRRQVLQLQEIDLNEVVSSMLGMLRRLIGAHIRLEFEPEVEGAIIQADRTQVEQIIMNLCVNAMDAMPEGGRIDIRTAQLSVDEEFLESNAWAVPGEFYRMTVVDTGTGMDEETAKRVFEPFFTTKEVGAGTGLGLSTVYGIVKQHDGMVAVTSSIGKGTTFDVMFPVARLSSVVRDGITVGD